MLHPISILFFLALAFAQCPSKQIYINNTCLPCHYTCSQCIALTNTDCTSCELEYFQNTTTNTCMACPLNCQICNSTLRCSSCNSGYYLDYTYACDACPTGVLTCTMSSIGLCQTGYFLSNVGYTHCAACSSLWCQECTNSTTCTVCIQGYLSNGLCLPCNDTNCLYCYASDYCQTCINGRATDQYGKCNITCSLGCQSCITSTICLQCLPMYYLNGYVCVAGGNVLCGSSTSSSSCTSSNNQYNLDCLSTYAYTSVTGGVCMISGTINGSTRQYYLSPLNNLTSFSSALLSNCFGNPIAITQGIMLIMQTIQPSYCITVIYQLYLLTNTSPTGS
jgi:hypothetical protein